MEEAEQRQILALSGGGYRGLYTAKLIALIESRTGKPFATHFDLIAGTSIGGILALALACEVPAAKVVELFEEHGNLIFKRKSLGYRNARYSPEGLKGLLSDDGVFGNRSLADCRHPVVIPSVNYSTGNPRMFKTSHDPRLTVDHAKSLVDVALATSAAPTFFPRHMLDDNEFVDGGLIANAPGLIALHEAEFYLGIPPHAVRLLSIGTMSIKPDVKPSANRDGGVRDWGSGAFLKSVKLTERLMDLTISANETLTDYMLKERLGPDRYMRVDEELSGDTAKAVGLAKTDKFARTVALGRASERAKVLFGSARFQKWLDYQAILPTFYHGSSAQQEQSDA